tara:strand:+ start:115 stop:501 length:387 start_codon:yes stop_codon:yes gene_type:complete
MATTMDIHCWVEDSTGKIIDPDFMEYQIVKNIRDLEGEKQYKKLTGEAYKTMAGDITAACKTVKKQIKASNKGMTNEYFWELFTDHPRSGFCMLNAMGQVKKDPTLKFCIGSMGWKKKGSQEIFWEFG